MAARNSVQKKVGKKASDSLLAAEAIEAARRDEVNRGLLDRYLLPEYLLPYIQD